MKLPAVVFLIAFAPRLSRLASAPESNGAIHILTDGNGLEVSCFVRRSEVMAQVNSPKVPPPQNQENAQQEYIA